MHLGLNGQRLSFVCWYGFYYCIWQWGLSLQVGTRLISYRASRSLLRQVFFLGSSRRFFVFFFVCYFSIDFDSIFLRFWSRLGRVSGGPREHFWSVFLRSFSNHSFWSILFKILSFFQWPESQKSCSRLGESSIFTNSCFPYTTTKSMQKSSKNR